MMEIYTIDSTKMVKIGMPGYQPKQRQARIPARTIGTDHVNYYVDVDGQIAQQIMQMTGIDTKVAQPKLLISILPTNGQHALCIYYVVNIQNGDEVNTICRHKTVSVYVPEYIPCPDNPAKSILNFELASEIVNLINNHAK